MRPVLAHERQHRSRLGRQSGASPDQAARPWQVGGRLAAPPAAEMAADGRRGCAHWWRHLLDPTNPRALDAPLGLALMSDDVPWLKTPLEYSARWVERA